MRFFYSLLFYLALPYVFFRLWRKSLRLPEYRQRLSERLGFYPFSLSKCIWVHAVSVGETLAAIPLIKALQKNFPDTQILVTTMTPTGFARVKSALGDTVKHVYIPYDLPTAVWRFLNAMNPVAAVIMETELWPNLLATCRKKNIPVCLVNARLSEKSANGYRRIAPLAKAMLHDLTVIAAHGPKDAERFVALGALQNKIVVTGNLKFDLVLPPDLPAKADALKQNLGTNRLIWIAASTHEGEEEIVLAAHALIRAQHPDALLILVPRHPDRFQTIAALCQSRFETACRSRNENCTKTTGVYLGDTMGELLLLYAASDVAFVGGSLIERGGHNLLEPGALGKPLLSGPHLFNFAEISDLFFQANALLKVTNTDDLAAALLKLINDPNELKSRGERALQVVEQNKGALQKQLALVSKVIGA